MVFFLNTSACACPFLCLNFNRTNQPQHTTKEKNMNTLKTVQSISAMAINIPDFPGFYYTILDAIVDNAIEREASYFSGFECEPDYFLGGKKGYKIAKKAEKKGFLDELIKETIFDITDFTKAHESIARAYAEQFETELQSILPSFRLKFERVNSPKEYNFRTDKAEILAYLSGEDVLKLSEFILSKKDLFSDFLKSHFTSYSGFCSFYSNDIHQWEESTQFFTVFPDNVYFEYCLLFLLESEGINSNKLSEAVYYDSEFCLSEFWADEETVLNTLESNYESLLRRLNK